MAFSFSYRGIRSENLGFEILDVRRTILPPADIKTLDIPGRPGTFYMRNEYGALSFEIDIYIKKNPTITDLQLQVRNIANFLDAGPGLGELIFDDEIDKKYNAIISGGTPANQIITFRRGTIVFLAPFPFAQSLNKEEFEIDGFRAGFTRASVAYDLKGKQVLTGKPRYAKGKFGDAIIIERGTSNGFTADLSSFESAISLTAVQSINSTVTRDITNQYHGKYSLKMETDGQLVGEGLTTINVVGINPSTTYTISLFMISNSSSVMELKVKEFNVGNTLIATTTTPPFIIPDETQPLRRVFITFTTNAAINYFKLEILTSGIAQYKTIWMDGLQIEEEDHYTSWQEGQITRQSEAVAVPLRRYLQNFDSIKEGTIEFEFSRINESGDTFSALLDWGAFTVGNTLDRIIILHGTGIGTPLQTISFQVVNGADNTTDTVNILLPAKTEIGEFYYVAIRWTLPGVMKIDVYDYKNKTHYSNSIVTAVNPLTFRDPPTPGNDFPNGFIGVSDLTFWVNAMFDEFRTTNRMRTDAEILAAPLRTRPLPVDESKVAKLTFDESFDLENTDVSNEGTAPVNHEITIIMQGAASYVQVELIQTGQFLRVEDALATNDKITFDGINKIVYKNDVPAMSILTLNSEFFQLPKDDNPLKITTDGTALGKIIYNPTWL